MRDDPTATAAEERAYEFGFDCGGEADRQTTVEAIIRLLLEQARPLWRWGDGYGGWVYDQMQKTAEDLGLPAKPPGRAGKAKQPIPAALRRAVHERDAYRCVDCGSWLDLQVDHVIPESRGGPTVLANLATRCRPCNLAKAAHIPLAAVAGE